MQSFRQLSSFSYGEASKERVRFHFCCLGQALVLWHDSCKKRDDTRERVGGNSTLQTFLGFGIPERNFEGSQLRENSKSLSPLLQTPTNELHVSI